jgi:hypothetical protein
VGDVGGVWECGGEPGHRCLASRGERLRCQPLQSGGCA